MRELDFPKELRMFAAWLVMMLRRGASSQLCSKLTTTTVFPAPTDTVAWSVPLNFARNRHRSKSSRRLETLLGGVSSEFCSESIHGVRALLCGASSEFCSESRSPLDLGIVNSVNVCGVSTRSCVELSQNFGRARQPSRWMRPQIFARKRTFLWRCLAIGWLDV